MHLWVHGDSASPVRLLTQKTALLSPLCPGESPDTKLGWFVCRSNQFSLCGCHLHQSYRYGCKETVLSYSKTNKIKDGRNQENVCVQCGNQLWFSCWCMRFEGKIWISRTVSPEKLGISISIFNYGEKHFLVASSACMCTCIWEGVIVHMWTQAYVNVHLCAYVCLEV